MFFTCCCCDYRCAFPTGVIDEVPFLITCFFMTLWSGDNSIKCCATLKGLGYVNATTGTKNVEIK